MSKGPSLWAIGIASTGVVLVWSGINDPEGGPVQVFKDLLAGKKPTPGTPVSSGAFAPQLPTGTWSQGGGGGDVVAAAKKHLGAPYQFAGVGAGKNGGIDCSGLVLVAFKDARGITLPHDATSQTRRGTKIPRDQVQAGDLVAWGSAFRYPHIAIAVDQTNCIGAWTYGVPCSIKPIMIKAVPGYGYPDIFRILDAPVRKPA